MKIRLQGGTLKQDCESWVDQGLISENLVQSPTLWGNNLDDYEDDTERDEADSLEFFPHPVNASLTPVCVVLTRMLT